MHATVTLRCQSPVALEGRACRATRIRLQYDPLPRRLAHDHHRLPGADRWHHPDRQAAAGNGAAALNDEPHRLTAPKRPDRLAPHPHIGHMRGSGALVAHASDVAIYRLLARKIEILYAKRAAAQWPP